MAFDATGIRQDISEANKRITQLEHKLEVLLDVVQEKAPALFEEFETKYLLAKPPPPRSENQSQENGNISIRPGHTRGEIIARVFVDLRGAPEHIPPNLLILAAFKPLVDRYDNHYIPDDGANTLIDLYNDVFEKLVSSQSGEERFTNSMERAMRMMEATQSHFEVVDSFKRLIDALIFVGQNTAPRFFTHIRIRIRYDGPDERFISALTAFERRFSHQRLSFYASDMACIDD